MQQFIGERGKPNDLTRTLRMTYVYGATLRGTTAYVREYAENEMKLKWPDEQRSYRYAQYLATKLFEGIARTVPAAEYAMMWLRNVAKTQPRGKRMEWTTPTGFVVQHDYQQYHEKKVFLRSCGVTSVMVSQPTDDTNPMQMQNAIAPNFVHALDASHLTLTALKMNAEGLDMVGIHDSFGTHACDVDRMHGHIRTAFVELYKGRNILGEFLWDVQSIGDPPMRGTLELDEVLDSEFFFC